MATLTIIIWLIVLVLLIAESLAIGRLIKDTWRLDDLLLLHLGLLVVHGIIFVPISYGIFWDLYKKLPSLETGVTIENVRFALITGFLALGAFSISSFFVRRYDFATQQNLEASNYSRLNPRRYSENTLSAKDIIILVTELVGFIASILGIIAFYLDFLK